MDVSLDGAPFRKEDTKGSTSRARGLKSLGKTAQFSSKSNRGVTDAMP